MFHPSMMLLLEMKPFVHTWSQSIIALLPCICHPDGSNIVSFNHYMVVNNQTGYLDLV